jgi:glycosyltransferase involved in cell wall biosynthesis
MGLLFYPRGGSAQVASALSHALKDHGWHATLACGSLGAPGSLWHAKTFFRGADVRSVAYDDAVARWHRGEDPMDAPVPMHPSFEAREGVPDRGFPWVTPAQGERSSAAWASVLSRTDALRSARILHLHHLTPLHDAAAAALPSVPVVTHLHGTELKMLEAIDRKAPGLGDGPHGQWWARRMRASARRARATLAISTHVRSHAIRLLGLDPSTVHLLRNGVDVDRFAPRRLADAERLAHWLRWLVDEPLGWDEATNRPGTVAYSTDEVLHSFVDPDSGAARPVLMFVGRFLHFKRVPLLVRAYARARPRFDVPAPLVIWGGMPGEFEGEHPHTVVTRERIPGVFFAGWRGHDQLALALNSADCFVAPSTDEPFGLVFLEAMACRLPVIGTRSGGPPSFVNVRPAEPDGWLVPPDDEEALADAMVAAVNDAAERERRGQNAARHAHDGHSWQQVAGRLADIYDRSSAPR